MSNFNVLNDFKDVASPHAQGHLTLLDLYSTIVLKLNKMYKAAGMKEIVRATAESLEELKLCSFQQGTVKTVLDLWCVGGLSGFTQARNVTESNSLISLHHCLAISKPRKLKEK